MKDTLFKKFRGTVEENFLLSDIVAYRIGGPARYYLKPESDLDFQYALEIARDKSIPLFILGSGSNLLVSDKGFEGIVLAMNPREKSSLENLPVEILEEDEDSVCIRAPAHLAKASLLDYSIQKKWSGLEFSAGIPGTLGGAVYMNAGTKWGTYGEVIESVCFYSLAKGLYELKNQEIGFKYRGIGEGLLDGQTAVLSVVMRLKKNVSINNIRKTIDEIYIYRGQKQPLELPNCGSVFKNPENSEKGAGRLIEASQLKGQEVGDAQVSLKHANFILNKGRARASDVKSLIFKIQDTVMNDYQILLETEVIMLGDF